MTQTEIQKHIENVKAGKVDLVSFTKQVLVDFKVLNSEYNCFSVIADDLALNCVNHIQSILDSKDHKKIDEMYLAGVIVSIKDCVCVKGVESTASSRVLKTYRPVFDATVVAKLKKAGAIIVGKTIQDEFGFGSFSTNVGLDYPIPKNPFDKERTAGGSSGGSAVITQLAIQKQIPHLSIAESTGGSIENPASFCGVIGFCPTYGRVSRYGLLSYSNSLDKIGIMGEKIEDVALGLKVISGEDPKDSTSVGHINGHALDTISSHITQNSKPFKVGVVKIDNLNPEMKSQINKMLHELKSKGATVEEVELNFTHEYGVPIYYVIAVSEASTNLACLCGLRYGAQSSSNKMHFVDYFTKTRSENFGKEAKRRIMLGTFMRMAGYRDAFYIKAAKARTKVIEEYKNHFKNYDILITPTMPFVAPKFEDIKKLKPIDHYLSDIMTVGPNLAGIPHMSFPVGKIASDGKNMPFGIMVMSDHFKENTLLEFGKLLESLNSKEELIIGGEKHV